MERQTEKKAEPVTVAMVRSFAKDLKWYRIEKIQKGEWTCECPRHQFTKKDAKGRKFPCKHLRFLWDAWRKGSWEVNGNLVVLTPEAL